jgi:hypothetical protein
VPQNQRQAFLQNRESEEFLGKIEKVATLPQQIPAGQNAGAAKPANYSRSTEPKP